MTRHFLNNPAQVGRELFSELLLKASSSEPFSGSMVRPILQSGLAGLSAASDSFDRSAAQVARLAGAPSAADTAATVRISPEARGASALQDNESTGGLEGALTDTRIAKYAFIANLKVLQTGDELSNELSKLGQKT